MLLNTSLGPNLVLVADQMVGVIVILISCHVGIIIIAAGTAAAEHGVKDCDSTSRSNEDQVLDSE